MPKTPKVAGQIISAGGERAFLVGEMLDDVLDLATWELVVDTRLTLTPDEEAECRAKLEAWEHDMKANPPKRVA